MRKTNFKVKKNILLTIYLGFGLCIGSSFIYIHFFYVNFHTVISNTVFRSAQLDESHLKYYTKKWRIKSMLNFCGAHPDQRWWVIESRFAQKNLMYYVSIKFEPTKLPSKIQLLTLVDLLENAPKPLLFHCSQGADRTGMAAAMSIILFSDYPTKISVERQASWRYGVISPHSVGYQVMQNYFAWLNQNHLSISKNSFMQFLHSPRKMKSYAGWFF